MNKEVFLNCLEYTGVETGTSVVGLYSFSSGLSDACFNQLYSSGSNYYNGLPYNKALPLIYLGPNGQPSGNFSSNNPYYINKFSSGSFGALISMNYSGCLHSGNINYILFSSTSGLSNNSGIILGITPSNRLFFSTSDYFSTISEKISENDFAFIGVEDSRFVNFGLYNLRENSFRRKSYDHGDSNLLIEKLYFGGVLNYKQNYTGYFGKLNEIYLFTGNLTDPFLNYCIDCTYATGYKYNQFSTPYTGIRITGSYWTGINEIQVTGYEKITGSHIKTDGSLTNFYYDSGKSGQVQIYESLIPKIGFIPYEITGSGIEFNFDTGKRFLQTSFNAFFDLGLYSGDIVEIYTYPQFNENLNLGIENNEFPDSIKEVQLFGNGLAETSGIDYSIAFNKQIEGFDSNDILMYDLLTGSSVTVPYTTGYINTGNFSSNFIIDIVSISGVSFGSGLSDQITFDWDIYLNGQKLIESVNYSIYKHYHFIEEYWENHIFLDRSFDYINNFNNLNDPSEFKLVPVQKNPIKNLYLISGDSFYLSGLKGFSEQIWKNGIRQKNGIDYFKEDVCYSDNDHYYDPNYSFELLNSNNTFVNIFQKSGIPTSSYFENHITKKFNSLVSDITSELSTQKVNPHQMFSYFQRTGGNINFVRNSDFFMSEYKEQLSCVNVASNDYDFGRLANLGVTGLLSKTCVALTKRHVILPNDVVNLNYSSESIFPQIKTGKYIYFLTKDNELVSGKLKNAIFYNPFTDFYNKQPFGIGILENDLPSGIEPCYILPSGYKEYLTTSGNQDFIYPESFPCFSLDNFRCVYTNNLYSIGQNRLKFLFDDSQRVGYNFLMKSLDYIDAGCPFFSIINDKFVLLSIADGRTFINQGPNIAEFTNFIKSSITTLNTLEGVAEDYPLKEIELNFGKKSYAPKKLNYLHDHIDNTMLSFLDNQNGIDNPIALYNSLPLSISDPTPIIRNTGHLANSLNEQFTCWCPWQNYSPTSLPDDPKKRHPTLITPRHVYLASHYSIPKMESGYLNGEPLPPELQYYVKFVSTGNVEYSGKIIARFDTQFTSPEITRAGELYAYDTHIALLDSDMPSGEIKPCYFLPENYKEYLFSKNNFIYPTILNIKANLYQEISFAEVGLFSNLKYLSNDFPLFNSRLLTWNHKEMSGDSGTPRFFVVNGKLVFITSTFLENPNEPIGILNKIIKKLNTENGVVGNYDVKTIDLSNFDKIENKFSILNKINYPYYYNNTFIPYNVSTSFSFINNQFVFYKTFSSPN